MKWFEKLKELRKEKELTLREVALGLAIPLQTYASYEHGTREPSIAMIYDICKFFDISADYLIGLSDSY
ncbi:MAG: helix-turn-helix transcriptional regulator [Clostridia bacterium]|nr:helix-turn-helix transcriptional regulator [Clostridia bacterium]